MAEVAFMFAAIGEGFKEPSFVLGTVLIFVGSGLFFYSLFSGDKNAR
jgi:hypothetical protein